MMCYAAEQAEIRKAIAQSYQHMWGLLITDAMLYTINNSQEDYDLAPLPGTVEVIDENDEGSDDNFGASDAEDGMLDLGNDTDDE